MFLLEATPLAIVAAVVLVVVLVRQGADAVSLEAVGPALAPLTGQLVYTIVVGGVALATCEGLEAYRHTIATQRGFLAFATVAGIAAAAILASAAMRRRKQHMAELAAIAEATQRVLLRPVPSRAGAVRLAARYISASAGAGIGGDLYDTAMSPAGLRLIIGDALGKGLSAVQTAAAVLGAFRESAHDAPDLTAMAERIETSLARQGSPDQFVTALLAQVSPDGSKVELLNRGHPPPLVLAAGEAHFVEPAQAALPLGLRDLGDVPAEPATIGLRNGDCLLLYTDGVSEARSASGEFFPLAPAAAPAGATDPVAAVAQISEELLRHVGHPLDDDAAMLLIRRLLATSAVPRRGRHCWPRPAPSWRSRASRRSR
jgi:serine phosphatase RsbU (regulator of sigma subunit)